MIRITFIAVINAAVNAEINLEDKVHAWTIFLTPHSFLDLLPNYLTHKITPRRQEQCKGRNKIPCMRCDYGQDGTPIAEPYCVNIEDGCPVVVCCDLRTEEPCYDEATGNPLSCVRYVLSSLLPNAIAALLSAALTNISI